MKGKWVYTDITPVNQLIKIACLIKPFYAAEVVLLERMIYKNKNQHQRARYYKRIQQVCGSGIKVELFILLSFSDIKTNTRSGYKRYRRVG